MAAPTFTNFSRNGLPSNTDVNYTMTYTAGSPKKAGVAANEDLYGTTHYSDLTILVSCNGTNTSSTTSCTHGARGKDDAQTVTAKISWTEYSVKRDWVSGYWSGWRTYSTHSTILKPTVPENTNTTQYQLIGSAGNWTIQYQTWISGYYKYDWNTGTSKSSSKSFTFYAPPEAFSFTNCTQGATWLVSDGINKNLITNLTNFQAVAKRWKQWKNQTTASACPSFDSPLSAKRMDEIYQYMGIITAEQSKFSTGDKISAVMFNDLATKINAR